MAPVARYLIERPAEFTPVVIVTGQHREMLDQVLHHFDLKADHDLKVMTPRQTLSRLTAAMLEGLQAVLTTEEPDIVLVHGDATSCLAGALAAFYARLPVGHVEAGLRTYDKYSPYPEELNRRVAGLIADLHFAPTPAAAANLLREGTPVGRVHVTGNTSIDALLGTVRKDYEFQDAGLAEASVKLAHPYVVVECHRRENWGAPMARIFRAVRRVALAEPGLGLMVSAHLNPEAGEVARRELEGLENVLLFQPLPYPDWVNLMAGARLILTDSGGLQEEAPSLGRPLLLARENTERPEAVEAGTVVLVGTSEDEIAEKMSLLLHDEQAYRRMTAARNPFGDGRAAERIAGIIRYHFGRASGLPDEFRP